MASLPLSVSRYFPFCFFKWISQFHYQLGHAPRARNVEKLNTDASKPVARHFNLPNHSRHNMTICGLSLHHGNTKSRKISNKNSFFNWVHSLHTELMNASHSTNLFTNSCDHISTNGKAPPDSHINHNSSIHSDEGLTLETSAF